MATYRCLADLQGKILEQRDIVIFNHLIYTVATDHITICGYSNNEIFRVLNVDPISITEQAYNYKPGGGSCPTCREHDYEALTRLVIELYKLLERKTSITSEKEQWYKITTSGLIGISPEQVKGLITKYDLKKDAIEAFPITEIITTKKEEKHENQFQRKKARIERGTRPEGSTVCGRRSKASVAVGYLGYRKVTGI